MEQESRQTEIEKIPRGWALARLEEVTLSLIGGGTPSTSQPEYWDGDIPWMTSANLTDRVVLRGMKNITEKGLRNSATNIVPKGSLLISTRVGIGKVGIAGIDVAISQDLTGLVPDKSKVNIEYLYWAILSKGVHLSGLSQGSTVKGLTRDYLRNLKALLPPLPEQKKVAEILTTVDQAIEKVDEAIEKTQKLKKGLMQELLTKGIGHKEFKDTEIGRIPKKWKVKSIMEIGTLQYGITKTGIKVNTGVKFLRITDITDEGIKWHSVPYCELAKSELQKYELKDGDILFARIGATTGKTCFIEKSPKSVFGSYLLRMQSLKDIDTKFLYFFTQSLFYWNQVNAVKGGQLKGGLNTKLLGNIKLSIPPLSEQQKIAEILRTVDKRLESLRNRKEKLERIKKGLMNDLLTGKVRVTSLISEEVPMREIEEIKNELRENMPILRDKYKVKTIGVFGSYIRGEQGKESDIDILVEFYETIDLFTFIQLEEFLSETLGIKVDLVMKDTLKPRIKDNILREAVTV